jgi:predicted MFS family arabinose efflux permease
VSEIRGAPHVALALAALTFATFVAVTTELLPIGLIPAISTGLGVSTPVAGLSISVFAVLVAVLAIPMTAWTERVPRKALLVLAIAGYAVSNIIGAIASDFAVMCVGRAIGGLSHAVVYSVVTAYVSTLVPPARVGRALSIVFAGASLGSVVGVPLTTFIGVQAGWRAAFLTMAVLAAVLAALLAIVMPGVESLTAHEDGSRYRPGRGLVAFVIADVAVFLGNHAAYTYIAPLLSATGVTGAGLSGALLLIGIVSLGGLFVAGLLADRHLGAAFVGSAAAISLTLLALRLVDGSIPATIAGAAIWCLAFNAVSPLLTTAIVRTGAVSVSTAGAVVNSASNVGITLGSLLGGGVIAVAGLPAVPVVGAALAAVATVVAFAAPKAFPRRPFSRRRAPS